MLFFVWYSSFVSLFFSFFIRLWLLGPFIGGFVLFFLFSLFLFVYGAWARFQAMVFPFPAFRQSFFFVRVEDIILTPHASNAPTCRANCDFLTASSFLNPSRLNFFDFKALVLGVDCKLCLCSLFERVLANSCVVKINYAVYMGGDEVRAVLGTSPVISSSHFHIACPQLQRVLRAWCHVTWPLQVANSKLDPNSRT